MRMSARFEILLYNEPFAEELQQLVFAKGYSLPTGWKACPPGKEERAIHCGKASTSRGRGPPPRTPLLF